MFLETPKGKYIKRVVQNSEGVEVEYGKPKKVALLFICLNDRYWPYIAQVIKDCKKNFLLNHKVDYFVWTDYNAENKKKQLDALDSLINAWRSAPVEKKMEMLGHFFMGFTELVRLYEHFYGTQLQAALQEMANLGLFFKRDGVKFWFECTRPEITENDVLMVYEVAKRILLLNQHDMDETLSGTTILDTEAVPWPSPTLMRYHLFLNQEEKLKEYDYLFYMDADMRVVAPIDDEILGKDLTVALHPMYDLNPTYVPPYEPNEKSTAFVPRLGHIIDGAEWEKGVIKPGTPEAILASGGKPRFRPLYLAGGFQGGVASKFIQAMRLMKKSIDKDFDNNYTAIWNDESHWNKYVFKNRGPVLPQDVVVLNADYVYPDSLIKEYYEPRWGRALVPKIITLTKPFSLSAQGAADINKYIK